MKNLHKIHILTEEQQGIVWYLFKNYSTIWYPGYPEIGDMDPLYWHKRYLEWLAEGKPEPKGTVEYTYEEST